MPPTTTLVTKNYYTNLVILQTSQLTKIKDQGLDNDPKSNIVVSINHKFETRDY